MRMGLGLAVRAAMLTIFAVSGTVVTAQQDSTGQFVELPPAVLNGSPYAYDQAPMAPAQVRVVRLGNPVPATSLPGNTRVIPYHVALTRAKVGAFNVPRGYRAAWQDERLNPNRAVGTLAGGARMELFWTSTVPRRLIDRRTGRDVTARVPLVYPYVDYVRQQREIGTVTLSTRNGQVVKQIHPRTAGVQLASLRPSAGIGDAADVPGFKPRAKALSRTLKREAVRGKRYVQVAAYRGTPHAKAAAAHVKKLGLPVQIGRFARGNQTVRLVLAGPFTDLNAAKRAVEALKQAGFENAFLRE
jgi:hypothetical protein